MNSIVSTGVPSERPALTATLTALLAGLADRYHAGWEQYGRVYSADLDQRARYPAPSIAGPVEAEVVEDQPVVRVWRGRVRTELADGFHRYLIDIGVPGYRRAVGNRGVWILRRAQADAVEFVLVTHWDSRAAVAAFAGPDPDRPLHHPETARFLLPDGERVDHFELVPDAAPRYASVRY